ncbi:PilW family protein [Lysinibacillus sp. NPDC097287]|uniref:PilW family protein n=1 Tax=Lysinibacillus sp. NPDC097287 TaxID=3364144 RepID=UPI0038018080
MRKLLNQNGLTLIEIVAVIAITSVILMIIYGIQLNSKEQYINQTEKNNQLTDISYTLKVITKDIRKSGNAPVINGNTFTIGSEEYVFDALAKCITRNSTILAQPITDFTFEPITSKKYKISITSTNESINTEIVIRSGT